MKLGESHYNKANQRSRKLSGLLLSNSTVDLELLANNRDSNSGAGYLPRRYTT